MTFYSMNDLLIYYGNSMRSVFAQGERLKLQKVSFEALVEGDIVAVKIDDRQYVHRVIEKNGNSALTMGDNNWQVDEDILTPESTFFLVTGAVNQANELRKVTGGSRGMMEFCRHQYRQRLRSTAAKVFSDLEKYFFWRRVLKEKRQFGNEICYYHRNRVIVRVAADGRVIYSSWLARLLYAVPEGK